MKNEDIQSTYLVAVLLTRTWASRPRTWRQNTFKDRFRLRGAREHKLRKSNSTVAQVHATNTLLNSVKGSKLSSW